MRFQILILTALLGLQLNGQVTEGAPVSGVLADSGKKAIPAAWVILSVIPAAPPTITQPFHSITRTGTDGRFLFENVPVGEFRICMQAPGTKFLNPCDWLDQVPTVKVASKAPVNAGTVEIGEGYLLEVDVKDNQGLIAQSKRRLQQANLSFAVRGTRRFHILLQSQGKAQDSQFSFVVPFETDLELITQASLYDVVDEENKSEQRDNVLVRKLRFAKNDGPKPVKIAVNGTK